MVQQTKYLALIQKNGFLILALALTSYQCFSGLSDKGKPGHLLYILYGVVLASDRIQIQAYKLNHFITNSAGKTGKCPVILKQFSSFTLKLKLNIIIPVFTGKSNNETPFKPNRDN